ncbi:DSBA-like thioredoxin domain protein [compost metagenome]
MKVLASDVQSEQIQARINDDMEEFQRFGFTGTPVLIVNGIALQGAQSPEEIERVIALTQRK